jgi:DNA segregation ATPase FtsK/SpoIIIE, S-DNA-T family
VDFAQAWSKIGTSTKAAHQFSAERINRTSEAVGLLLDAAAPSCAPLAARWDAEADRRRQLRTPEHLRALMDAQRNFMSSRSLAARARSDRTRAKKDSKNPLSTARRAARTAHKAACQDRDAAKADLKSARRDYPDTLTRVAVKAHAAHAVPAGIASYVMSTPADWTVWPASVSAALIAANVGALWLGRRKAVAEMADGLSAEERALMERLDPSYWVEHADDRGLAGTVTTPPQITPAGVMCGVRLDGRWSVKELKARADAVRALLGMRTETRMEIGAGAKGNWARIIVRTRSASDGMSMIWTPDHTGIGVDEVTGEVVDLPLKPGVHILLAGITGMGKSVSWRPLAMRAHLDEDWAVVVIDPKRQEAIGWQHCLRCVGQEPNREQRMADIYAMAKELTREMHRRQGIATGPVWVPDGKPENRFLLVPIDEGAAIVRMAKQKQYADVMDLFEELWSEARSVGLQFIWATQFPTKAVGVPAAVKENMSARLSLTVGAGEAERAIFGESAQQEGWLPSKLDGIPGRAMLQYGKRRPDPVRMWLVTDDAIAALPSDVPWRSPGDVPAVPVPDPGGPRLQLVKSGTAEVPAPRAKEAAPVPAALTDAEAAVLDAVRTAGGPVRQKAVVDTTGLAKGTVSKTVTRLVAAGHLVKAEDGTLTTAAGEVSA